MAELRHKLDAFGLPAVLKIDRSWGGRCVAIVRTAAEAEHAFTRLRAWPGIPRAMKYLLIDRDATLVKHILGGQQNTVSLQKYVEGRPSNAAVACWQGKVLATVLVEVLAFDKPTGPATMVRVVTHAGMSTAIERMVKCLKLSGLCGFDFILQADGGGAQLIELDPRATPTCHLVSAEGQALGVALCGQLRGDTSAAASLTPNLEPLVIGQQGPRRKYPGPYLTAVLRFFHGPFTKLCPVRCPGADLTGSFCTERIDKNWLGKELIMPKKRFGPEQFVKPLWQILAAQFQGPLLLATVVELLSISAPPDAR